MTPDPSPPTVLTEEERDAVLASCDWGATDLDLIERLLADRVAAAVQEERAAIVAGLEGLAAYGAYPLPFVRREEAVRVVRDRGAS